MKVRELIDKLKSADQDAEIVFRDENSDVVSEIENIGGGFCLGGSLIDPNHLNVFPEAKFKIVLNYE